MEASPVDDKSNQDIPLHRYFFGAQYFGALLSVVISAGNLAIAQVPREHPNNRVAFEPTHMPALPVANARQRELVQAQPQETTTIEIANSELRENEIKESSKLAAFSFFPVQRPIGQLNISVTSKAKAGNNTLPENLAGQVLGSVPDVHAATADEMETQFVASFDRKAQQFAYQPLYFEQANVERYGRPYKLHAAASALRFYATIPALPYAMTVHHANQKYYWRWPYEAGWAAPRVRELPPVQLKGGLVEAGAITGLTFLVP